jgi:hypothetical protein
MVGIERSMLLGSTIEKRRSRLLIAALTGVLATGISYRFLVMFGYGAGDFTWPLRAAQAIMAGQNPYQAVTPTGPYPFHDYFTYPLPVALLAVPFLPLAAEIAGALFFGLSSALLAWQLSRDALWRFPLFLSTPYLLAATLAQWGPFALAAALGGPLLGAAGFLKPTLGAIAFAYHPSRRALAYAVIGALVSLVLWPGWPLDWWATLHQSTEPHNPALLAPAGFVLLLAALRWRKPEGRALLLAALMPRHPYWYDALMLWLIPTNFRQSAALTALSWVGFLGWRMFTPRAWQDTRDDLLWAWQIATLYLPALVLILRGTNDGGRMGEHDR